MTKKYQSNPKFIIQHVDHSVILFDPDRSLLITLNETASKIFKMYTKGTTINKIVQHLDEKYDVPVITLKEDIKAFIKKIKIEEIIIPS